jgi:hypothetical protein
VISVKAFRKRRVAMRYLYLGLLWLLLLGATSARAAACPPQPANPDGTTITSPAPGQAVTDPFTVKGVYNGSFEGVVPIRLLDAAGTLLLETQAHNECCKLAPYETAISYKAGAATDACLVVYRESGADGSLTPLAQVPIRLGPAGLPGTGGANPVPAPLLLAALALLGAGALLRRRCSHA